MAYNRLLVTLDGSELSELAIRAAAEVAAPGAHIHILSVLSSGSATEIAALASAQAYPTPTVGWPPVGGVRDPRSENAREQYLGQVSEWLSQADFRVTTETREGEVVPTIVQVARGGFDLIVMVTHAYSRQTRQIMGSVAEAVLRESPCPMLIVPAHRPTSS